MVRSESRECPEPPAQACGPLGVCSAPQARYAAFASAQKPLSLILPFHEEGAQAVSRNLTALVAYLDALTLPYRLILVDDGSADDTPAALRDFAAAHAQCTVVLLPENRGKGAALLAGLPEVVGEWVLLLDGDCDLDPAMLPHFFEAAERTGADVVLGSKRHPRAEVAYPLRRRLCSALYRALTQWLLKLEVSDTQSGMKLLRSEVLAYAAERMLVKAFAFDLELLTVARGGGYRFAEAPVRIANFGHRWGCLGPRVVWRTLVDTLAIAYRERVLHYYATLTPLPATAPEAGQGPRFSLIVACPGDSVVLRRLIDALCAQTYRNFEVLFLPDHLLVRPEVNYRFRILATGSVRPARKRNQGAAAATGDVLVFIDDDAYPRADWLANAAARFTQRLATSGAATSGERICALGGPGLTPPEDPPMAQLSGAVFASPLVSGNFRYRYFIQGALRRVEDFPSCNLFVRREAFEAIGGFREDFWPGEDTLLCAQLQQQGYALWYDPRVVVYHHRRPLFGPHLRQVGRYALHRGYFARRVGLNSRRLSYHLPALFVLGLLLGPLVAWVLPPLGWLYGATIALYLLLTGADALLEAPALRAFPTLWCGIVLTHLWYGVRFLQGSLSRKMPCGVRPFDHR